MKMSTPAACGEELMPVRYGVAAEEAEEEEFEEETTAEGSEKAPEESGAVKTEL